MASFHFVGVTIAHTTHWPLGAKGESRRRSGENIGDEGELAGGEKRRNPRRLARAAAGERREKEEQQNGGMVDGTIFWGERLLGAKRENGCGWIAEVDNAQCNVRNAP